MNRMIVYPLAQFSLLVFYLGRTAMLETKITVFVSVVTTFLGFMTGISFKDYMKTISQTKGVRVSDERASKESMK